METKKEECKGLTDINKQPYFYWNKELVAEFANEVALAYKNSEMWSSDLTHEKHMLDKFIKRKKFETFNDGLLVSEAGQTIILNKQKFNELIDFLYNYKDDQSN